MDLTFSERETAFRDELRVWLESNPPGPEPHGDEDAHYAYRRDWQRRLADGGWAGVHWPAEYGGRGATLTESAIFFEELGRSGAPLPANVLGLLLAGLDRHLAGHVRTSEGGIDHIVARRQTDRRRHILQRRDQPVLAVHLAGIVDPPDQPLLDPGAPFGQGGLQCQGRTATFFGVADAAR